MNSCLVSFRNCVLPGFLLVLVLCITSCSKDPKDEIARPWKLVNSELDLESKNPAGGANKQEVLKLYAESNVIYDFKSDGTYELSSKGGVVKNDKGKWELDDKTKILKMHPEAGEATADEFEIKELSNSNLKLHRTSGGLPGNLYLEPAKK